MSRGPADLAEVRGEQTNATAPASRAAGQGRIALFFPRPVGGGSRVIALQLAHGLREHGWEVAGLAPFENQFVRDLRAAQIPAQVIEAAAPLRVFGGSVLRLGRWQQAWLLASVLLPYNRRVGRWLAQHRIDVLYAGDDRAVLMAGFGARRRGIPVVWHVHGGLTGGQAWVHRLCAALATRIVCVSESVAADVKRTLLPRQHTKVSVIHNGLPDVVGRVDSPELPPRRAHEKIVLLSARLVPAKGAHHLIAALAGLDETVRANTVLWLAGAEQEDPDYVQYLRDRVAALGLGGRVRFLGQRSDVPDLVAAADMICCPSIEREELVLAGRKRTIEWKEGFCLGAAEGMRAAKPVIGSRSYGIAEVVENGVTGLLVSPGDSSAITAALTRLLRDQPLAAELGLAGRRRYKGRFTAQRMIGQFNGLLQAVVR